MMHNATESSGLVFVGGGGWRKSRSQWTVEPGISSVAAHYQWDTQDATGDTKCGMLNCYLISVNH